MHKTACIKTSCASIILARRDCSADFAPKRSFKATFLYMNYKAGTRKHKKRAEKDKYICSYASGMRVAQVFGSP